MNVLCETEGYTALCVCVVELRRRLWIRAADFND